MPRRDVRRWRRARLWAFVKRSALGFAVVIAILLGAGGIIYAVANERSNDRQTAEERLLANLRDEARKYQACVQRKRGLTKQNTLAGVARASLLTAHHRQALQARRTTDPQLRARYLLGSRLALERRARLSPAELPRCRATYPTGYRERMRFPDLAKQTAPPRPKAG